MELALRQLRLVYPSYEEARAKLSEILKYSGKGTLKDNTVKSAIQRGRKARMR